MFEAIAFYFFSAILIASAVMVIAARNPVHSVLFLILTFFNAAGLFVLLGAEFLAMILIVVYVGAVAVLFLFVVMMLDIDFAELKRGSLQYLPFGVLIGLILVAELAMVGSVWVLKPALVAAKASATPAGLTNTAALGRILYTDYVYYFQIAGLVLLVAMIGAIVLTLRSRPGVRRQVISVQNARTAAMAVDMHDLKPGEGAYMTIGLTQYLTVAAILFTIGVLGIFLNRKNIIIILMSVELILLAVNINFVAFSAYLGDLVGQVFALFVLTVAAAEAAIGLAILVVYFRNRGTIAVEDVNLMKG
jgi:NADH-quinone oxidoreductase subunit J